MPSETGQRPGPEVELRQIYPAAGTITVGDLLGGLDLASLAPADRPYTIANFVQSVDGHATFQGRSGPLGGDLGDRSLFHGLREIADAVLAGTRTLVIERYGRLIRDPARRDRRVARGLAPEPLAVIVTRSLGVPRDVPLLEEPEARVVVYSRTTFTTALRRLRAEQDVRLLLCEGGPTIFRALIGESLIDELFLTVAPALAGGGVAAPTILGGPPLPELHSVALAWALERAGTLFLRYRLQA